MQMVLSPSHAIGSITLLTICSWSAVVNGLTAPPLSIIHEHLRSRCTEIQRLYTQAHEILFISYLHAVLKAVSNRWRGAQLAMGDRAARGTAWNGAIFNLGHGNGALWLLMSCQYAETAYQITSSHRICHLIVLNVNSRHCCFVYIVTVD